MYKTTNKKIDYNRKKYEIFWVTDFAQHIIDRQEHESHGMSLKEIEDFAVSCKYYPNPKGGKSSIGLGLYNGKYYEVISYIEDLPHKRSVIKTCYIINDYKLIKKCNELFKTN